MAALGRLLAFVGTLVENSPPGLHLVSALMLYCYSELNHKKKSIERRKLVKGTAKTVITVEAPPLLVMTCYPADQGRYSRFWQQ